MYARHSTKLKKFIFGIIIHSKYLENIHYNVSEAFLACGGRTNAALYSRNLPTLYLKWKLSGSLKSFYFSPKRLFTLLNDESTY